MWPESFGSRLGPTRWTCQDIVDSRALQRNRFVDDSCLVGLGVNFLVPREYCGSDRSPFALFGSYILLQIAPSLVILAYPLSPETRGILGFLVFITSIPGIAGILLLSLGLAGVRIWTS